MLLLINMYPDIFFILFWILMLQKYFSGLERKCNEINKKLLELRIKILQ